MLLGGEFGRPKSEIESSKPSDHSESKLSTPNLSREEGFSGSFVRISPEKGGIFERLFGSDAPNVTLARRIKRTIPPGISIHRVLNYHIRGSDGGLAVVVIKCTTTPKAQNSLSRWVRRFESEHRGKIKILTEEVRDRSSILRRLSHEVSNGIVGSQDLTKVRSYIDKMQRVPPTPRKLREHDWGISKDLSDLEFVAVDGVGTRDREDLIYAEKISGTERIRLHVAFIDVTPYLHPGSALDKYACGIGMSIYGLRSKIRTLGAAASENEFSFVEGERRPAFVVSMEISRGGKIARTKVRRAIVKNHRSFDPESASREIDEMGPLSPGLLLSFRAAERLFQSRLESSEAVRLDSSSVQGVLIGESMVAAKSVLAEKLLKSGTPAIFRNHEFPSESSLAALSDELRGAGIKASVAELRDTRGLIEVLSQLSDRKLTELQKRVLNIFIARSTYSPICRGHAAIGVKTYAEIKGRDSVGILNQMQLRSLRDPSYPRLSRQEVSRRAFSRNRQGERMGNFIYELMTLDRLDEVLSNPQTEYLAELSTDSSGRIRASVEELGIDGVLKQSRGSSNQASERALVKVVGYSIPKREWQLERVTPDLR